MNPARVYRICDHAIVHHTTVCNMHYNTLYNVTLHYEVILYMYAL